MSPDGSDVYVVSVFDDSITHFTRGAGGSLGFASCLADGGASGCTDLSHDSLDGASGVAVTPDGTSVYVASGTDDSITHFARGMDGSPTEVSCVAEGGASGCTDPGPIV